MQAEDVKKLEGSPELSEIWNFCPMGNPNTYFSL